LTIVEKSEFNPTVSWVPNPITELFILAGGLQASSEATRTDTVGFFETVTDIVNDKRTCARVGSGTHPSGSLLIDSDLKITEWLLAHVLNTGVGEIPILREADSPFGKKNVLSHGVKFQVVTGGNISPSWKLARVTVNPGGPLLALTRDRTHDLSFTFGPLAEKPVVEEKPAVGEKRLVVEKPPRLAEPAEAQFFASQVGQFINRILPRR
jgi:hypothetical protein